MSSKNILIAALSGRALAASARRAGYVPYVVDAFGDADTRALAGGVRTLPGALRRGFRTTSVATALAELSAAARGDFGRGNFGRGFDDSRDDSGDNSGDDSGDDLILGPGFEAVPELVAVLEKQFTLIGCGSASLAAANDPARFFATLGELGIEHPPTSLTPPADTAGWLSKRAGASGGRHIRRLEGAKAHARAGRYFQKEAAGEALSALAITGASGTAFAFTRSWCAPRGREPFRFGGIASSNELDADLEARLIDTCLALIGPLALIGLVSFDFLVSGDDILLVDVNPRPGASLDILDDDHGTLFKAHIAACRGQDAIEILAASWRPWPRASAYLYADRGTLTLGPTTGSTTGPVDWPDWVSDIPPAGQTIPEAAPIATVHAKADTAELAEQICQERLAKIGAVLYGQETTEDN